MGLDFEQDWTDHKPISRSSVKSRNPVRSLEGLRFHAQIQVDFRTAYGSCERQTDVWTRAVRFRQAHGLPLKPLNSRHWIFYICSNWFSPLPTSFRDGCPREYAICSIAFPLIKPTILQQK